MILFEIYIVLGFISNFTGPLARKINNEIRFVKTPSSVDVQGRLHLAVNSTTQTIYEIILRTLNIILYPILYIMMGIGYINLKRTHKRKLVLYIIQTYKQKNKIVFLFQFR